MKINSVIVGNLQPLSLTALLEDNTTVDIVGSNDGEAFLRIGSDHVERYTALSEAGTDFDRSAFWAGMHLHENKQLAINDPAAFTGFNIVPWILLATVSTVANYPENPLLDSVTFVHEYSAKTMMPSMKRDIKVEYVRAEQANESVLYYFGDAMAWLAHQGDLINGQFMVGLHGKRLTITAKYKGVRDNRHLGYNDSLDKTFGRRHSPE